MPEIYSLLDCELGNEFPENKPYAMYHSKTVDRIKSEIQAQFSLETSHIRIVVGTSAIGMGIDIKDIRTIIIYAPPNDIESYVQGIGRAGRDGNLANSIVFVRPSDFSLVREDAALVKFLKSTDKCRRKILMDAFDAKSAVIEIKHNCCDVCAQICNCLTCSSTQPTEKDANMSDKNIPKQERKVSISTRNLVEKILLDYNRSVKE